VLWPDVLAFVRASLPEPPVRVLEIGAGDGALADVLRGCGFDVMAVDPHGDGDGVVAVGLVDVDAPSASFDAAVSVVSLHHVVPLGGSMAHLANLVRPGGLLIVDEFDVSRIDDRAMTWWVGQQRAIGRDDFDDLDDPSKILADMQAHLHPVDTLLEALVPYFHLGSPVWGPYLHRWHLPPGLRDVEVDLIGSGKLPATGARMVGVRRDDGGAGG
jgi:SAM-dependent methyltransferase